MARLSDEEIEERLGGADGWSREEDAIVKEFDRGNFKGSVDFLNEITPIAEDMNHHPDVFISWSKVRLSITNHAEGGLTNADFELAGKVDELAAH
jgi:4a-hydroxytetrahydrobiopterin dehydratase